MFTVLFTLLNTKVLDLHPLHIEYFLKYVKKNEYILQFEGMKVRKVEDCRELFF